MSTEPTLVSTEHAAKALGLTPAAFRRRAHGRLEPVLYVRVGRSTRAVWDLDQVYELTRHAEPSPRRHSVPA